jgi:hypothetical protein
MRPLAGLAALAAAAGLALTSLPAAAHHGTAVSYDQSSFITVRGVVTDFLWRNPHSALFLDLQDEDGNLITGDDGEVVNYAIELSSPNRMIRTAGWTRDTFQAGDEIVFRVHPSRTGAPVGECLNNCQVTINGEPPRSLFDE